MNIITPIIGARPIAAWGWVWYKESWKRILL